MLNRDYIESLTGILEVYSDCRNCGAIIDDPQLRTADPLNPGRFKSLCPSCNKESARVIFPGYVAEEIIRIIIDCAESSKPALVVTLACTVYEVMLDDFLYRLLERYNCPDFIAGSVVDLVGNRVKDDLIAEVTGKKIKKLAKDMGFKGFWGKLQDIKNKRNNFLHRGLTLKKVNGQRNKSTIPHYAELDDKDIGVAIEFIETTIRFFAKLSTKYGAWQPGEDPNY